MTPRTIARDHTLREILNRRVTPIPHYPRVPCVLSHGAAHGRGRIESSRFDSAVPRVLRAEFSVLSFKKCNGSPPAELRLMGQTTNNFCRDERTTRTDPFGCDALHHTPVPPQTNRADQLSSQPRGARRDGVTRRAAHTAMVCSRTGERWRGSARGGVRVRMRARAVGC